MYGVNINCKEIDYIALILARRKLIETRKRNTLKPLVGQRVGLIRTGKGPAMLVGYATITDVIKYTSEKAFRLDRKKHLVPKGSKYDFDGRKYGYVLSDVVACDPVPVNSFGISYRKLPEGLAA